jgi:hypothetical protein
MIPEGTLNIKSNYNYMHSIYAKNNNNNSNCHYNYKYLINYFTYYSCFYRPYKEN